MAKTLAWLSVLGYLAFAFFYPVGALVGRSFFDPTLASLAGSASPGAENSSVLGQLLGPQTVSALLTTLRLAGAGTLFSLLLGLPLAWVLYTLKYPGRTLLRTLMMVPFVLPTIGVASAFKALYGAGGLLGFLHWEGSAAAVVSAMVFYNASLVARIVGPVLSRLDPRPGEAARSLGAGALRAWVDTVLPRLWAALASAAALVFLYCTGSYSLVMILGGVRLVTLEKLIYDTLNVELNFPLASAQALLQVGLAVVVLVLSEALQNRGVRAGALLPTERLRALNVPRAGAGAVILLVFALVVVAPLAQLVVASLQVGEGYGLENYRLLFRANASAAVEGAAIEALVVSLRASLLGALLALLLGTLVTVLSARRGRKGELSTAGRLLDLCYTLPLGVSSVVIGLGFLVSVALPRWGLERSWLLLPLAQALGAIPLVVRVMRPLLQAVEPRQRWVASALGAAPWRVFKDVDGPLLVPGLLVAAGYAFAVCFGEFGAASFLVLPTRETLPVIIFRLTRTGAPTELGMALALSVLLSGVNALVMVGTEGLRRGRGSRLRRF